MGISAGDIPVIFLSAYGREELVVRAFDAGAVDYLVKPFSPTELAARIRAALRRREAPGADGTLRAWATWPLDFAQRRVTLGRQSGVRWWPWSTGCWRSLPPTPGRC